MTGQEQARCWLGVGAPQVVTLSGIVPTRPLGNGHPPCALGSGSLDQLGSRVNLIEDDLEGLCSYQLC